MEDLRFAVARLADLALDADQLEQAVRQTRLGGEYRTRLTLSTHGVRLHENEVVFVMSEAEGLVLIGVGLVYPEDDLGGFPRGLALQWLVTPEDGLPLPTSSLTRVLQSPPQIFPREIPEGAALEWWADWRTHLEGDLNWWGEWPAVEELASRFREVLPSAKMPTPVKVPEKARANSRDNYRLLSKVYEAPLVFATAQWYLRFMRLQPSEYSISALPDTGRRKRPLRRAFTISVGKKEVLHVDVSVETGEIGYWEARIPEADATRLRRWRDLDFAEYRHGHYIGAADLRLLFRTIADPDDAQLLRAAVDDLVDSGLAHRRSDWHNPDLERALTHQFVPTE